MEAQPALNHWYGFIPLHLLQRLISLVIICGQAPCLGAALTRICFQASSRRVDALTVTQHSVKRQQLEPIAETCAFLGTRKHTNES